jgi:hypothetical protein
MSVSGPLFSKINCYFRCDTVTQHLSLFYMYQQTNRIQEDEC